jgi:hypothetical protein
VADDRSTFEDRRRDVDTGRGRTDDNVSITHARRSQFALMHPDLLADPLGGSLPPTALEDEGTIAPNTPKAAE